MNSEHQPVLILGCGGFLGSHLVETLLSKKLCSIIGVDLSSRKISHLLGNPAFEYHELDLTKPASVDDLINRSCTVINMAAICNPAIYNTRPLDVIDINFTHVVPIVRACADGGKRFIHFSTCEVYGRTLAGFAPEGSEFREDVHNTVLSEDTSPLILGPVHKQRWTYSCAKQLLERVIYAEGRSRGLAYTIIRPFNVIGPRMDFIPGIDGEGIPRVIPSFMKALLFGEPLTLVDGGRNRRSFIYIDDAMDAVARILNTPDKSAGQIFNIGSVENETTIAELAHTMRDIFTRLTGRQSKSDIVSVTSEQFYGEGYDDCDRRVPDISKAAELLDWFPSTPLRDLLAKTIAWYIAEYGDRRS